MIEKFQLKGGIYEPGSDILRYAKFRAMKKQQDRMYFKSGSLIPG